MGNNSKELIDQPLLTLEELFTERYFVVPDYQRGYSWEEKQLVDLRKDIENLYDRKHKHYTGTIVATPSQISPNTYEIVDGQQRITTLIILLKTIINSNPEKYSDLESLYIQRGEIGNRHPVLSSNEETRDYFEEVIIRNRTIDYEIKSHECISKAKTFFSKWITDKNNILDRIVEIVTNQLGLLLFTPDNDKEIGIMFEVINNRGKDLSQLEKIKNYFIYFTTVNNKKRLRETINRKWTIIQKNLSFAGKTTNEEENRFIRYCYIVFFDTNKEKSWKVYDQLKLRFNANLKDETYVIECIETIENFLEFVSDASLHYAYFHSNNYFCVSYKGQYKKNFQEILKLLRCQHTNASILPLYLAIMSRLTSSDNILKIINLLVLLEKVNFRIYILPKVTSRADSKQGDMFWFAKEFFDYPDWRDKFTTAYNDVKLEGDIFDWLEANLIQITKYYCPELKFIQSLTIDSDEAEDYYQWNGMRYFLANYEKQLQSFHKHDWGIEYILQSRKEAENNDYLSREHIWAQNHRISDFKAKYIEKRRLGNFVLLGLASNIKLSDNEISAKIIELNNYNSKNIGPLNLVQVHELQEFYSSAHKYVIKKRKSNVQSKYYFSDLSRRINDERETKLIRFALDRWKLPGESLTKFIKVDSFLKEQDNEKYIIKESLESKQ